MFVSKRERGGKRLKSSTVLLPSGSPSILSFIIIKNDESKSSLLPKLEIVLHSISHVSMKHKKRRRIIMSFAFNDFFIDIYAHFPGNITREHFLFWINKNEERKTIQKSWSSRALLFKFNQKSFFILSLFIFHFLDALLVKYWN